MATKLEALNINGPCADKSLWFGRQQVVIEDVSALEGEGKYSNTFKRNKFVSVNFRRDDKQLKQEMTKKYEEFNVLDKV